MSAGWASDLVVMSHRDRWADRRPQPVEPGRRSPSMPCARGILGRLGAAPESPAARNSGPRIRSPKRAAHSTAISDAQGVDEPLGPTPWDGRMPPVRALLSVANRDGISVLARD